MTDRTVKAILKADVSSLVNGMKQAQKATKDFATDAKTSAAKNSAAWDQTGKGMMATGAVMAAGLTVAVKAFMDFDASMSQAQAGTSATGAALGALRAAAIDAGAKTSFSATEAADAITAMGKAGVSTKDILGGGLTGALSLAAAGQLDVGQASEIAATAMNQFGLEGKDIPHIADLLAAGAGKAMGSVQDLAGALKYVGPVAKGLNVSIEETTGTLAMLAQQGILGEQAGTSLRGVLLTLTSPSAIVARRMEELHLNMYDANGEFIGMAAAAGQLQTRLGTVDEATRNAALGQIFGNEQVTAARILYEGGAGAVEAWTKKVNDAGFAAEQAAMLTDNLKGDVERLGGSLSSVLINAGSGANGMLRTMTQELQGAVDLYGSAPIPIQKAATVLGTVAAAALLTSGGLLVLAPRIIATKAALDNMGRTGALLSGGLSKAGAASKMLGGPLVIATVALGYFAKQSQESKGRVDELAASLDQQTGAVTDNTRAWVNKNLSDTGMLASAKSMGVSVVDLTDAVLGNSNAVGRVDAALKAYGLTLAGNADITTEIDAMNALKAAYGGGNDELNKGIEKTKLLAEANDAGGAAAAAAIDPVTGLTGAEKDLTAAAEDNKKAHDALTAAITGYGSAMLTARGDARGYEAAIDAATASLKENGRTLDIGTEKGRNNATALDGIATSALKMAESNLEAAEANGTLGTANKTVAGDVNNARTAFINAAVSMGMNKTKAAELATQAGLTAPRVQEITDRLIALGKQNPRPSVGVTGAAAAVAEAARVKAALDTATRDRFVSIFFRPTPALTGLPGSPGYGVVRRADGGPITGVGGPRQDNIPIMGSVGEFMVNAKSYAKHSSLVRAINADKFADGGELGAKQNVHYMASGGFVAADFSAMSGRIPTSAPSNEDLSAARLRQAKATTALHAAESALFTLRHTKGHTARQISVDEQRISNARGTLTAATKNLRGVEAARSAAAKPFANQFHAAATGSNAATGAFLRNIDTLNKQGFHTLADQLLMASDAQAYQLAAAAVKSATMAKALTKDVDTSARQQSGLAARQDAIGARDAAATAATDRAATLGNYSTNAQLGVKSTAKFYANLRQLADRGFTALASRLLDASDEQAEIVAEQAAGASDAVVSGLNTSITSETSQAADRQALADSFAGVAPATAADAVKDVFNQMRYVVGGGLRGGGASSSQPAPAAGATFNITEISDPIGIAMAVARRQAMLTSV
jgi:TP901 family phage tail tape measure protein